MSSNQEASKLEPWNDLRGKVVMVTGASSGLGKEFCHDLAKAGCKIVAAARREDRLKSLCHELNQLGPDGSIIAVPLELDICSKGSSIEDAVQKAWDAFGRIDALINNAGIRGGVHTPLDLTEEEWDSTIRTNVRGAWLVSKYVCMHMRAQQVAGRQGNNIIINGGGGGGSIINISSIVGLNRGQLPGALAYASSKAALNKMTEVMAMEFGMYKIRVNSISPGIFKSEITEGLMQKDWLNKVVHRTVPLGTFGTTDPALTSVVRYLIHDSSQYVSGNVFIVDAGATLPGLPIFSSL